MYYEARKKNSVGIVFILILLIIIIFILIRLGQKIEHRLLNVNENVELTGTNTVFNEFNLQDLIENAGYSVVGVSKLNEKNSSVFVQNSEEKLGIGSGIILTANGLILSNFATTGGKGETCFVTFKNGTIYPAVVKWADTSLDISIIKIAADNLLYLPMSDSNQIAIGDKYYLLSNATGYKFNESLNEIFISKSRATLKILEENNTLYAEDVIQIDLKIDYENNGGAVLNENGEIFGIASQRINAIIPINRIKNIIQKLREEEEYKEAYLGIYGFDNSVIKYLVPEYDFKLGIYVEKVEEDSPVYGEIVEGDILIKIDDYELSTFQDLSEYLYSKSPKEKVKLVIIRGTKEILLEVVLKERPRQL